MIKLEIDKPRAWKPGVVVHLKVQRILETSPGKWTLWTQDVTPLPGALTSYYCDFCGKGQPAQEEGSLPEGWTERKAAQRSRFACSECGDAPMCARCGCTDAEACLTPEGPCTWVAPGLCSACVTELPIQAQVSDDKGRPRLVMCPVLHCRVDVHKCYRCHQYRGRGERLGQALVVCAAPPVERKA